ncbi:MAG: hypothetical protein ACMVO5_03930 [Polymorphobacter sp.]|uniref:hypothetical protein n=1 Tax=Polymorphobacter sp. TaxID=1909290 RepID=UPI003A837705
MREFKPGAGAQRGHIARLADKGEAAGHGQPFFQTLERCRWRVARAGGIVDVFGACRGADLVAERVFRIGCGLDDEIDKARFERMDKQCRQGPAR